jgi:serine/threonine protein kinase/tetratricopeptide (TPR) repeat protein
MVEAWRRGERPLAEDVLARHPELDEEAAIRLIYEEACLRLEAGMAVDPAAIAGRFPRWRRQLEILLDCELRLRAEPGEPSYPEVGESLIGFHLIHELGRGASGRVFLASQPSLADRRVVLKMTALGRQEHLSLARLQHMHIVPLYSEHLLQDRALRVLCMPFLGGATLDRVLAALAHVPPRGRTGQQLVEALDRIEQGLSAVSSARGPFRGHLARSSYVEAVTAIGACLADGLQYAHERGLVHMDVKPSNVLLADDGQPMLLDFHLARGPVRPTSTPPAWLGGTPAYMAPEQAEAVRCVRAGRPIARPVDHRADVYALGLILYEALAGAAPAAAAGRVPSLRAANPRVSPGLDDIIRKCLAPDPLGRYADTAGLAIDLRCHLGDLPLRGVPNRSPREAWRKWRRRKPHAFWRAAVLLVAAAAAVSAAGLLADGHRRRVAELHTALADGRAALRRHQFPEAARILRRGLEQGGSLPWAGEIRDELRAGLAVASRHQKADELHELAEQIRFRYALALPVEDEARRLVEKGHEVWRARGMLAARPAGGGPPEFEQAIKRDMLDFVRLWTELLGRLAPPERREAIRRQCLRILADAEAEYGRSPALDAALRAFQGQPDLPAPDPLAPLRPRSAWDHYALGTAHLRTGKFDLADAQFQRGLDLRPEDFWLNFYHGLCAYRSRDFAEASHAFHVCIVLSPRTAECYYNRGRAYQELGHVRQAIRDYDRALELNPGLGDAARNRAILLSEGQGARGRP